MARALVALAAILMCCTPSLADSSPQPSGQRLLTDFAANASIRWYTVNDNVMGGRSRGGFRTENGVLLFTGSTNTNGGGFSSIRSRSVALNLREYEGVRLRLRADGRKYTFRLTTSSSSRGRYSPTYWAEFNTPNGGGWTSIDVPFSRFSPRWRGRQLRGPALDLANINSLGLMIYDKKDGPFRIEVDSLHAYKPAPAFSLAEYRWKKRPFVVFAPGANDPGLTKQLAAVTRDRARFDERDMLLIVVTLTGARIEGKQLDASSAASLRRRFNVATSAFATRLVGKDGSCEAQQQ